jgi:queuosine precursor transporter
MDLLIIFVWICLITAFTLIGSWYSRRYNKPDLLIALYVAFVIFSNIVASKVAEFDLGFYVFYAPAAVLIFSVTFLMTDIVNEKFGRKETHKMIFIAFIAQVAIALFSFIIIKLDPAPFYSGQSAFESLLGQVPRLVIASWIAFLISENLDAYLFAWFKNLTKGKHLWMRNAFSSIPAMLVDSVLFVTIAFYGTQPILSLILGLVVIKWIVGIINIPFMYLNRWVMYYKKE